MSETQARDEDGKFARMTVPAKGTVGNISLDVAVYDGKYRVVNDAAGLRALRYGERWRELVGDNLVLQLALEVERLREVEAGLRADLTALARRADELLSDAQQLTELPAVADRLHDILHPPEPVL